MTGEDFVMAIRRAVRDAAIEGTVQTLENPPGRRPRPELLAQSDWYRSLSEQQRELMTGVVRHAVDSAVFGFLCVLDGVRVVEDDEVKGDFELRYIKGSAEVLSGPDLPMLHEIYNAQ
jgi:hypothetical protein